MKFEVELLGLLLVEPKLRLCLGLLLAVELLKFLEVELLRSRAFKSRIFIKSYLLFGNHI